MQNDTSITMLNTSLIVPNKYQPRKIFDENELKKLAESIKIYGIINPILVRKKEDKYEIIAGERRFRATQMLGLKEIPAIIKNADEQQMAELALIENIQRKELSPIEEAKFYEEIMKIGNQTQQSLAKKLGKSQSAIANKIRLLALPTEIQDALSHKMISERHARSLLSIEDKDIQLELLNRIINEKLTVKETEQIINSKEIGEEEIKSAIDELMKSLNIKDDSSSSKEEKKEDDNMMNGNFFPNYDNNNNNNASLNTMNMQSMNQPQPAPEPEMVMPTLNQPQQSPMEQQPVNMQSFVNPTLGVPQQTIEPSIPTQMPQIDSIQMPLEPANNLPLPAQTPINEIQMQSEPIATQPLPEQTSITQITPLFNTNPMDNQPIPEVPQQPQIQMTDEPLFNPNAVMPTLAPTAMEQNQMQPMEPIQMPTENIPEQIFTPTQVAPQTQETQSFEIPIVTAPSDQQPTLDLPSSSKIEQLKELLNTNGYTYKLYSNNESDCIIIELAKN